MPEVQEEENGVAWEFLRGRSTLDSLLCSQREHSA